jgi:2'-hydroxyisoflavone reductase
MRILVIGGSRFLGRHIVSEALGRLHEVTLFNRGASDPGAFPEAELIRGDRNDEPGLGRLAGREWDATIDVCAYVPGQVRSLLEALGGAGGHYTLISSISVYEPGAPPGFTEDAELVAPSYADELTMEEYGALKVGCELTSMEMAGEAALRVRPGYVVGPHDPTHRFGYWLERCSRGGLILGPAADQPIQVIDARDLASFVVGLVEQQAAGAVHAAAPDPAFTFFDLLTHVAEGVGAGLDVAWSKAHHLLPLTESPEDWTLMTAGLARAVSLGLTWRPLAETTADTLGWMTEARAAGRYNPAGPFMTAAREHELLQDPGAD